MAESREKIYPKRSIDLPKRNKVVPKRPQFAPFHITYRVSSKTMHLTALGCWPLFARRLYAVAPISRSFLPCALVSCLIPSRSTSCRHGKVLGTFLLEKHNNVIVFTLERPITLCDEVCPQNQTSKISESFSSFCHEITPKNILRTTTFDQDVSPR